MEFLEVLNKRYSCRNFKNEKIDNDSLNKLLSVISLAPSACNFQPVKVFVIEDENILQKLDEVTKFRFDAKTVLMICHDERVSWHRRRDDKDHGIIDSTIVATYLMLNAYSLGLGTTYVSSFNDELAHNLFSIPSYFKINCLLPIGIPSDDAEISERHFDRKDLKEIVSFNKFDNENTC